MKLKSTPKPVRYRITSGELEHSSLGSLLQHFDYEELKKKWPSVIRWLERQGSVAEGIAKQLKENPNPTFEEAIIIFFKSNKLVKLLKEWIDCGSNNLKFLRLEYFIDLDSDSINFVYQHRDSLLPNVSMKQWREIAKNSSTKVSPETLRDIEKKFKEEDAKQQAERNGLTSMMLETNNLVLKKIIEIAKELGISDGSVTYELKAEVRSRYRGAIKLEGTHKNFIDLANHAIQELILNYFAGAGVGMHTVIRSYTDRQTRILDKIKKNIIPDVPPNAINRLVTYKEILDFCQIRPNK